jgi:signal transduction histidine kinase
MLKTLFRPSQSWRASGLDIGLYQSRQIIEAHGGTVQVRSEAGKGTQVRIEFPLHGASETKIGKLMAGSAP